MENNNVSHPAHYTDGKIECIDFIVDKALNFSRGNAVKYIVRAGKKDPAKEVEDLRKAAWYINHEIDYITPGTPEEKKAAKVDALAALMRETVRELSVVSIFDITGEEEFDDGIRLVAERLAAKGIKPEVSG